MSPELRAVIQEIERQRADLASGMALAAAYERVCSRAAEAVFAAETAKAKIAEAEAKAAEAEKRVQELLASPGG